MNNINKWRLSIMSRVVNESSTLRTDSTSISVWVWHKLFLSSNSVRYKFTNNLVQLVRFISLGSARLFHGLKNHILKSIFLNGKYKK